MNTSFPRRTLAAAVILTACSCSSVRHQTAKTAGDPFLESSGPQIAARDESAPRQPAPRRESSIRQVGFDAAQPAPSRRVTPAVAERESSIQLAQAQIPAHPNPVAPLPYCPPGTILPDGTVVSGGAISHLSPDAMVSQFPDEYLFDGGDRGYPVHYDDFHMLGLESEDTVAEYVDEEGRRKVKPSNRVAVYSPRFAAVTSVSTTLEDVSNDMLSEATMGRLGSALRNREATFAHHQRDQGEGLLMRSRASGVQTGWIPDEVHNPVAFDGHAHTTVVVEDLSFLHTGQMTKADEARLAASIESAGVWTRNQNPVIAATSDSLGEVRGKFDVAEMVGHDVRSRPGTLRIVKLADKKIAAPGEIIKFIIRFDNLGDRPVRNVVISDNLTPRLEYIDDSATCDRDGRLVTVDNGEGNLILRWELDEPLPGRTGGVATFEARVR